MSSQAVAVPPAAAGHSMSFLKLFAKAHQHFRLREDEGITKVANIASSNDIQRYEDLFAKHGVSALEGKDSEGKDGEDDQDEEDDEEDEENGGKKKKKGCGFIVETSDLEKLRMTMKHVVVSKPSSLSASALGKIRGHHHNHMRDKSHTKNVRSLSIEMDVEESDVEHPQHEPREELLSIIIPCHEWEKEVLAVMHDEDDIKGQRVGDSFVPEEPTEEDIEHSKKVREERQAQIKANGGPSNPPQSVKKPLTSTMAPQAAFIAPTGDGITSMPLAAWQIVKNPAVTHDKRWQALHQKAIEDKMKEDGKFWKVRPTTIVGDITVKGLEAVPAFPCLDRLTDDLIECPDDASQHDNNSMIIADEDELDRLIPNDEPYYNEEIDTNAATSASAGAAFSLAALGDAPTASGSTQVNVQPKQTISAVEQRRQALLNSIKQAKEANRELRIIQEDRAQQRQEEERKRLLEKRQRIENASTNTMSTNSATTETAVTVRNTTKRARNVSLLAAFDMHDDALLHHHAYAVQHRNTRPILYVHELKFFHRPHMRSEKDYSGELVIKKLSKQQKLAAKANAAGVNGSNGTSALTAASAAVGGGLKSSKLLMSEKDRHNLSLASGDSNFVIIEYVEEFPPIMMNYGMTSAILNYYRSNNRDLEEAGDEDHKVSINDMIDDDDDGLYSRKRIGNAWNKRRKIDENGKTTTSLSSTIRFTNKEMETIKKTIRSSLFRVPRHLQLLWELKNRRRPYDYDANIPRSEIGQTKVLDQLNDASPFLGEIENGTVQPALVNKLFRTPLFPHDTMSKSTRCDFLLIVKHKNKLNKSLQCIIREIPYLFLAGQCEPLMPVPRPVVSELSKVEESFYRLSILRYLNQYADKGGIDLDTILKTFFGNSQSATAAQQGGILLGNSGEQVVMLSPYQALQRRVFEEILYQMSDAIEEENGMIKFYPKEKDGSDEEEDELTHGGTGLTSGRSGGRGGGGFGRGGNRRNGRGSNSHNNTNQSQPLRLLTEEQYMKQFTPEDICLQESCNSAEYRLFRQHVFCDIEVWRIQKYLEHLHKVIREKQKRFQELKETEFYQRYTVYYSTAMNVMSNATTTTTTTTATTTVKPIPPLPPLLLILARDIKRLQSKQSVARYLLLHLVRAPWNTTSTYVNSVINRDENGYMEVKKYADPSGRGEGFAFYRSKDSGVPNRQQKRQYVDSDKDLRKLHGSDAIKLLVSFGMPTDKAKNLKRWDRIDVLRTYINDAYHKNTLQPALMKYVRLTDRGQVNQEQFKRDCQDIWKRQRIALASTIPPPPASIATGNKSKASEDEEDDELQRLVADNMDLQLFGMTSSALEDMYDKLMYPPAPLPSPSAASQPSAVTIGGVTLSLRPSGSTPSSGLGLGKAGAGLGIVGGIAALPAASVAPTASTTTPSNLPQPPINPALLGKWPEGKRRPLQAVRKIVRKIDKDGKETVTISFSFSTDAIIAAREKQAKAKREREDLMLFSSLFTASTSAGAGTGGPSADVETTTAPSAAASTGNLSISLKKMSSIVERHSIAMGHGGDDEMLHLSGGNSSHPSYDESFP